MSLEKRRKIQNARNVDGGNRERERERDGEGGREVQNREKAAAAER